MAEDPQDDPAMASRRRPWLVAAARGACFVLAWLCMMPSLAVADLAIGLAGGALAVWASLHLLPPAAGEVRLAGLLGFLPHFLAQSALAGIDVARRAFDPRLPLSPGYVSCHTGFPAGLARSEFRAILSLMPGSVPVGELHDRLILHCLDVSQPIARQLAAEEALLADVLLPGDRLD